MLELGSSIEAWTCFRNLAPCAAVWCGALHLRRRRSTALVGWFGRPGARLENRRVDADLGDTEGFKVVHRRFEHAKGARLARFFIDDSGDAQAAKQRPAAIAALSGRAYVSVTVLLELQWMMRAAARAIARVVRALAGMEHVTIEDRDGVLAALVAFDAGLDFAEALHVMRSSQASAFATFDRRLARRAKGLVLSLTIEVLG